MWRFKMNEGKPRLATKAEEKALEGVFKRMDEVFAKLDKVFDKMDDVLTAAQPTPQPKEKE